MLGVGTAALGRPAERSSTVFLSEAPKLGHYPQF
jgi:hypothetical protein